MIKPRPERRRHPRSSFYAPIKLFDDKSGREFLPEPDIADVSRGGIRLQLAALPAVGQVLRFRIERYDLGPIAGKARVRWARPWGMGYECGAEFLRLGWIHGRRLRLSLDPYGFDVLKLVDGLLLGGIAIVLCEIIRLQLKQTGNPLAALWDFIQP